MRKVLFASVLWFCGVASTSAAIYKCHQNGHVTYSNVDRSGRYECLRNPNPPLPYLCKSAADEKIFPSESDISGVLSCSLLRVEVEEKKIAPKKPPSVAAQTPERRSKHSTGTAFAVSNSMLLTNNHVVENCTRIRTQNPATIATIRARDKKNDLALLETTGRFSVFAEFRLEGAVIGEEVMIAGYPLVGILGQDLSVTKGVLSSTKPSEKNREIFLHTAPTQPGNSGGPVFDNSGRVLGVVVGKLNDLKVAQATGSLPQNMNIGIHGKTAQTFLSDNNVQPKLVPQSVEKRSDLIAANAAKFTVLVHCFDD
jgi:S1-C subfamily serine protease